MADREAATRIVAALDRVAVSALSCDRKKAERRVANTEIIPVIDLGPYLSGTPGAIDRTAGELRYALTEIGFYFIINHGVSPRQIGEVFRQVARFHAQPLEKKLRIKLDKHNVGYLPMRGDTLRTSTVETVIKPNLNEAFFVARDLPGDHPDVLADRRFRSANRWPSDLPGFREVIVDYCDAMERLAQKLVRLYARALGLPTEYFDQPFKELQYKLRMTHYPQQAAALDDEFGIAPHTDTSFLTLLAPNEVPGLSIRTRDGKWIAAPAIPDAFVVNGGQLLQRWTNDYFLATPHRAVNRSGGERYALAFFCDSNINWPVAAVPTCVGPDKPPKYPTTYYTDYMIRYQQRTYNVFSAKNKNAAE
jgi:isopenicillin N synthase-like dioxygenase